MNAFAKKILGLGLLALTIGASGCTATSASGGGWIPSAACNGDPSCNDKAIFGGHVACDPNSGGRVSFTYRDSAAGVTGRFDGLIPTDFFGQPYACGATINALDSGVQTAGFLGTFHPNKGADQTGLLVLLVDPTGVKGVAVALDNGYGNEQPLSHGNFVIH